MKPFDMAFPETVSEASTLLAENDGARVIAGGTAMNVVMKEGVYHPDLLINIRGLADELSYVEETDDEVRIGALTTLREVERNPIMREHLPTVVECLEKIAGVRVRNTATLGGHLAHADIHLDLPPVLGGYDAEVVVSDGDDTRRMHVKEFLQGYYETDLADEELITEIVMSKPGPNVEGTYLKHRYYSEVDWPCVGVAAFVTTDDAGDSVEGARVLLNSVSTSPILRVEGVDEAIDGTLSDEAIEAVADLARDQSQPSDDLRGSAEYKERMAGVFTRRALEALAPQR